MSVVLTDIGYGIMALYKFCIIIIIIFTFFEA